MSKLKQHLLKSLDCHKEKYVKKEKNNTTSRVKYQENTKRKNLAADLDDFKRFVKNELLSQCY